MVSEAPTHEFRIDLRSGRQSGFMLSVKSKLRPAELDAGTQFDALVTDVHQDRYSHLDRKVCTFSVEISGSPIVKCVLQNVPTN